MGLDMKGSTIKDKRKGRGSFHGMMGPGIMESSEIII